MKNGRVFLAILFACVLTVSAIMKVSAQDSGVFDLAITQIETIPFSAGVGEEITVSVTYENLLPAAVPSDVLLDLVLTVTDAQTQEVIKQCRQPVDFAGLSSNHEPQQLPFPDCKITVQQPNTHLVRAEFVKEGEEPDQGPYKLIAGDVDAGNNGDLSTIVPTVIITDDDLPAELARIFAGLAIFFAVMALVAAGTEVVIDTLKVGVGLKRKVTTVEALERMEKYLPGQLAALSVSAASREQFKRMLREMRQTLDTTLVGVSDTVDLKNQVANGEFGEAYRKAEELLPNNEEMSQQDIYKLKKQLFSFANRMTNTAENQLQVTPEAVQPMRDQIAQQISLFDGQNPGDFVENLFETLQETHFWAVQITDGWLQEQEEVLFDRNSTAVMAHFETEVRPILEGIGFSKGSVDQAQRELASRLRIVESGVSQTTDTFISSVKNVLDAVELRRFETQSPSRKVWRILRSWYGGVFPPVKLRGIMVPSIILSGLALYVIWLSHLINNPTSVTRFIENRILGSESLPWLPWFLLFFTVSYLLIFLLILFRKARDKSDQPWFVGLYGATALSLLSGLFLVLILWLLQAYDASSTFGQLSFFSWTQPWWSWLVMFSTAILALLLITGQIGKVVYDRLVRTAVHEGKLAEDRALLKRATILRRVETLWNLLRFGFDITKVNPENFGRAESVSGYEELSEAGSQPDFEFSAETTAQFIMVRTDQQRDEETSRLRILRVMSITVGLLLAYLLQIDVLQLLGEAFPGALDSLNVTIVTGETLHTWRTWLPAEKSVTVGIVLTGFAASAGSAFWHDRLDKLQASKKGAQAAATLLNQASQVVETVNRK
jgi:hypothetical protein